jgi:hypothetical protein
VISHKTCEICDCDFVIEIEIEIEIDNCIVYRPFNEGESEDRWERCDTEDLDNKLIPIVFIGIQLIMNENSNFSSFIPRIFAQS